MPRPSTYDPLSSQIYGVDLVLDESGDFSINSFGDLGTSYGSGNLTQAISNRLKTERGNLVYDSSYGVDLSNVIGRKNLVEKSLMIKRCVRETLLEDPRVNSVLTVDVLQDISNPSVLYVEASVIPIDSQLPMSVNMVFPWVSDASGLNSIFSINNEGVTSSSNHEIHVLYNVYNCEGVWLNTDTTKLGTNYFLGGNVDGRRIVLGTPLPSSNSKVVVDYSTLDTVRDGLEVRFIKNEIVKSVGLRAIQVKNTIYDVSWVGLASDVSKTGENLWSHLGGTYIKNIITFDQDLPSPELMVLVDYSTSVRKE